MISKDELRYIATQVEEGMQSGTMESDDREIRWFIQITEERNK